MRSLFVLTALFLLCVRCSKLSDALTAPPPEDGGFATYTIRKGNQFCEGNAYRPVATREMKFTVLFDSSAVYQTLDPVNQYDINKLYGFSDNNASHHQYSARLGWRWSDGALRLFAYVYNEGKVSSAELAVVPIGQEIPCSIKARDSEYVFTAGKSTTSLPRSSTTVQASGYQLYPYFGGDEVAPHEIRIRIREDAASE